MGQIWDRYGMGMGWVWDGDGTGMGRVWDGYETGMGRDGELDKKSSLEEIIIGKKVDFFVLMIHHCFF